MRSLFGVLASSSMAAVCAYLTVDYDHQRPYPLSTKIIYAAVNFAACAILGLIGMAVAHLCHPENSSINNSQEPDGL